MTLYTNYNVKKTLEYERIDISVGIEVNKTNLLKNVIFVTIGILNMLVLTMKIIFIMDVMI